MDKIAFFDLETTGTDVKKEQIVEIAIMVKSWPNLIFMEQYSTLIKPTIPIPSKAIEVHGITPQRVAKSPYFKDIANQVLEIIKDCAIAGFNSNAFDVPLLYNEFARVGINWDWKQHPLIDVGNIFKIKEERTLSAAAKFYLEKEHKDAHNALADTIVTAGIFGAQRRIYDLPTDLRELELFSNYGKKQIDLSGVFYYGEDGEIYIGIGSAKGKRAKDDFSFVGWIYKNNFPADVHDICKQILYK